jgi:hypothetical protein
MNQIGDPDERDTAQRLVQLQVNLAVMQGHYEDAVRPHFRGRARAAQYTAIRDIPFLLREIERLRTLLNESRIRYASLRAAALAIMAAHNDYQTDPSPTCARPGQQTTGGVGADASTHEQQAANPETGLGDRTG